MSSNSTVLDTFSELAVHYNDLVSEKLHELPKSYYLVCIVLLLVLSRATIFSVVSLHTALHPIKFPTKDGKQVSLEQLVNSKIPALRNRATTLFNPLLSNGHLQTMFAVRKFRHVDRMWFGREMLELDDGATVALDRAISQVQFNSHKTADEDVPRHQKKEINGSTRYLTAKEIASEHSDDNRPMIIALHGLSGSSAEAYCRCLLNRLADRENFDCYVLNSRGCANTVITTPDLFCALWTRDVRHTVKLLKKRFPNRPLFAVGYSMGSCILTNYLAQEGANSQIDFAVTMACIWDLRASSCMINSRFISSKLYSPVMTVPLLKLLSRHSSKLLENPVFAKVYTPENIAKVHSLTDFDDNFTSHLFGFSCADEYYTYASPIIRMNNIRTPLLNINSVDDPIAGGLDIGAIPLTRASHNPYITILLTNLGGHLGWFKWNNVRWYADPVSSLLGHLYKDVFSQPGHSIKVDPSTLPEEPHLRADYVNR